MKTYVLTGSRSEIAEHVTRMEGVIREVLVFVEEPADTHSAPTMEEFFAEMEPYTVDVGDADDSRKSVYTRMGDE